MLKPGDSFGDYRVVRLLGEGGMGSVYLLESAEGVRVAAKILDPETAGDHESRKRFVREAQLALGVRHPNLVETYDVGEDPDTGLCYILMEYVPGGSLADRIEAGPLSIGDAVSIARQVASVLELARQNGVVHRDIKPENILFGADGTPKLADLGIARGSLTGTKTTTVTHTGMLIGTPAYMAPEQMLDAHGVDVRADIYSLGIVLFEMLTGERPNKDDTVVQLMAKAVKGEPLPDVRTLRPDVPAALAKLLARMVVSKKEKRIASPLQLAIALEVIGRGGAYRDRMKRLLTRIVAKSGHVRRWMDETAFLRKALPPAGVILVGLAAVCIIPRGTTGPSKAPRQEPRPREARPQPVLPPKEAGGADIRTNESRRVEPREIPPVAVQKPVEPPGAVMPDACRTNVVVPRSSPSSRTTDLVRVVSPEVPKAVPPAKEGNGGAVKPAKSPEPPPVARTGAEVMLILKNTKLAQVSASPRQPLSKAVDAIRAALNPHVNFCLSRAAGKATARYSFGMKNVQAENAVRSLCNAAGCRFEVHDNVVCIAPVGQSFRWKPVATSALAASAGAALSELRFPKFRLRSHQRIGDALEMFRRKTDAERPFAGIRWIDGRSAEDRLQDLVPMDLEDVSVWTALELVCNIAEYDFDCHAKSVELYPLARRSADGQKESSRFSRTEILRMRDSDGEVAMRRSIERMFRGWRMCRAQQTSRFRREERWGGSDALPLGYVAEHKGQTDVLRTCGTGELMEYAFRKPVTDGRHLCFWASGDPDTRILVTANGRRTVKDCGTLGLSGWRFYDIDLSHLKGETPTLTITVRGRSNEPCVMHWHGIAVR